MSDSSFRAGEMGLPAPSAVPTMVATGYVCSCGAYVAPGAPHSCFATFIPAGQPIQFSTPAVADARTTAALERIATALEKLAGIGTR